MNTMYYNDCSTLIFLIFFYHLLVIFLSNSRLSLRGFNMNLLNSTRRNHRSFPRCEQLKEGPPP